MNLLMWIPAIPLLVIVTTLSYYLVAYNTVVDAHASSVLLSAKMDTITKAPSTLQPTRRPTSQSPTTRRPTRLPTMNLRNEYNDTFTTYVCLRKYLGKYQEPGTTPRFMVIGTHKSGTTAMYSYLAKHGHVRPALCKEIKFFDREEEFQRGRQYYLSNFPNLTSEPHFITGEGSASYIYHPQVARRIYDMFPEQLQNFRFIAGFRNPTERFFSDWIGLVHRNATNSTCAQYWLESLQEFNQCLSNHLPQACEFKLSATNSIARGIYAFQLDRWLKLYSPTQFLLFESQYMFTHTLELMQHVVRFLGLREYSDSELDSFAEASIGTNHLGDAEKFPHNNNCSKELQVTIDKFYHKYNLQLRKLLKGRFAGQSTLAYWLPGGWIQF